MRRLIEQAQGLRVVAIGAHPDDIEIGAGGFIARLVQQGAEVVMAIASVPTRYAERRAEATEAARILGANLVVLYDGQEARVEQVPMYQLVARLDALLAQHRPDLVITHSAHDLHWDHRLVNHATVSALRRTRVDLLAYVSSPEMSAHRQSPGRCFADVGETMERKLAAIAAHESQSHKLDLDSARELARTMGRASGVQYAEAFEALRLNL